MFATTAAVDPASPVTYWAAIAVFTITVGAVVTERIHKTKAALFGAAVMIASSILTQQEAFHSLRYGVDYNVIFLLVSMMILVDIVGATGVFGWAAIRSAKMAGGHPLRIMVIYAVITAVASAFLDNVTTVLLLAPVTLLIADQLDVDPVPFLIVEALASNIGGTATLIGDPPNIIIASRAGLSFGDFIVHLAPIVVVMMVAFLFLVRVLFRNRLRPDETKRLRVLAMDERKLIKDPVMARRSLAVLGLTLVGFTLHGALHLEPATVALFGASLAMLVTRTDPAHVLGRIEWPTIFFFIGLFIVVGGLAKVGAIGDISQVVIEYTDPTEDDMFAASMTILWFSAILSSIVDNIPYVATMSPLVLDMANNVYHDSAAISTDLPTSTLHHPALLPVWFALALGSCLGGNGTPIGASANVIVLGMAERAGRKISFLRFVAYGFPVMIGTLIISHVYLVLRYY